MTAPRRRRTVLRPWLGAASLSSAALLTSVLLATTPTLGASAAALAAPMAPTTTVPTTAGPTSPLTTEQSDVVVEVTAVEPAVLRPGEDLQVTVRIENTRPTPVAEPRLLLHLDRRSFISRTSLDRWRTADIADPVGSAVVSLDLETPLAARATTTATLTLPASSVGLRRGYESWGPRGIAVETVDRADPARSRLGLARTFLLWFPIEDVTPTRVSTLVPLVGPAVDPYERTWVAELEELTHEDGRLGRVLAATAAHREVTWVLDPWLVDVTSTDDDAEGDDDGASNGNGAGATDGADDHADIDSTDSTDSEQGSDDASGGASGTSGSDDGSRDGNGSTNGGAVDEPAGEITEAPEGDVPLTVGPFGPLSGAVAAGGARAWATELAESMVRRDVELLPYLDPDVAALAHAGDTDRLLAARSLAEDVVTRTALPDGTRASLGWTVDPLPDQVTAELATRHGERAVVIGPGELPPTPALTYTPSGRTTVPTSRGDVVVLIPDSRLSAALRTGSPLDVGDVGELGRAGPTDDAEPGEDGAGGIVARPPTPAVAAQDLLAELAVITRERPSDSRHMLLTAPRDWSPDPAVVDAQMSALRRAPWVQPESVSALVGAPDTGIERDRLPARAVHPDEISSAELDVLTETVATRLRVAEMVPDPAALVGDAQVELLAPAGVAWREDPTGRTALVDRSVTGTEALRASVEVLQSSTVNLLAATGGVPVRVANALPQDTTVMVTLVPGDARLRIDEPIEVTVPAGGEQLVRVPVHAIQSADLEVGVVVTTPSGEPVDDDAVLLVRVRAEWEGIGTAVIAGLLALGMLVGLVRAIRQGRRTGRRARPVVDDGPDALSPEARTEDARESTAGSDTPGNDTTSSDHEPAGRPGGT